MFKRAFSDIISVLCMIARENSLYWKKLIISKFSRYILPLKKFHSSTEKYINIESPEELRKSRTVASLCKHPNNNLD